MTILLQNGRHRVKSSISKEFVIPDRSVSGFPATRHSPTATCAAFSKESRMKFDDATNLDRKSGAAEWSDLLFRSGERFFVSCHESRGDGAPGMAFSYRWSPGSGFFARVSA